MTIDDQTIKHTIHLLGTLRQMYEDEVVPSMIDDGNPEDRTEEINEIIRALKKI